MKANQTGIFISIKAWLPTGKSLDDQFNALSIVKAAHTTGDYAPLLAAAVVESVQTEQRTRRMDVVQADDPIDEENGDPVEPLVESGASVNEPDTLPNPIKGKKVA